MTGLTVLGTLLSSSLVGYAFATLPGRGKQFLFNLLLATVMVPASVTLIPLFVLFSKLGWVNTYLPLVVPHFFANAFYVFLFRQFFRSLPAELFESAELDGCNPWMAYWRIALPLSRPALATVAVFAFIGAWNDFLGPLVYLSTNAKFTLSLGLSLFQGIYFTQLHYLMPMSLVALLPVLILFLHRPALLCAGHRHDGIQMSKLANEQIEDGLGLDAAGGGCQPASGAQRDPGADRAQPRAAVPPLRRAAAAPDQRCRLAGRCRRVPWPLSTPVRDGRAAAHPALCPRRPIRPAPHETVASLSSFAPTVT